MIPVPISTEWGSFICDGMWRTSYGSRRRVDQCPCLIQAAGSESSTACALDRIGHSPDRCPSPASSSACWEMVPSQSTSTTLLECAAANCFNTALVPGTHETGACAFIEHRRHDPGRHHSADRQADYSSPRSSWQVPPRPRGADFLALSIDRQDPVPSPSTVRLRHPRLMLGNVSCNPLLDASITESPMAAICEPSGILCRGFLGIGVPVQVVPKRHDCVAATAWN